MVKIIKFDLPINGIKVKDLDELKENLTDEIVKLARSGQLARWLRSRHLVDEATHVESSLANAPGDAALFTSLCDVLGVQVAPEDISALFSSASSAGKSAFGEKYRLQADAALRALNEAIQALFEEAITSDNSGQYYFRHSTKRNLIATVKRLLTRLDNATFKAPQKYVLIYDVFHSNPEYRLPPETAKGIVGKRFSKGDAVAQAGQNNIDMLVAPCNGVARLAGGNRNSVHVIFATDPDTEVVDEFELSMYKCSSVRHAEGRNVPVIVGAPTSETLIISSWEKKLGTRVDQGQVIGMAQNWVITAPCDGTFSTRRELGEKVPGGSVVATIEPLNDADRRESNAVTAERLRLQNLYARKTQS